MRVKLDEVVDRITGNVDRFNTDLVYYVGGEHYESSSIAIYYPGLLESEKGQTLGFKFRFPFTAGDVLFMARNPHLRKAGKVMFDGICSDASYILRTKDNNVLLQDYLSLVIQNDNFWDFFEANKSGSVNYLMNWKEMRNYEFELPDIEKQRKIAALAWSIEETRVAYKKMLRKTDELVKSQFIEMFGLPELNVHGWESATIRDVVTDVRYGTSKPAGDKGRYTYLRMNNITYDGQLDLSETKVIDISDEEIDKCLVQQGDLLFNRTNSRELVGKTCVFNENTPMVIAGYIIRVRFGERMIPEYISTMLNIDYGKKLLFNMCNGAIGQANINAQELQKIAILVPPMELQLQFKDFLQQADKSKFKLKWTLSDLDAIYKKIISENLV